jgi:malate dehydrogenase (oxaloacetate-decarboxylating)(NADP+)
MSTAFDNHSPESPPISEATEFNTQTPELPPMKDVAAAEKQIARPLHSPVNQVMANPLLNKGDAASKEERVAARSEGLMPAGQLSLQTQVDRAMQELRRKSRPIEKYIFMQSMQDTNETLYYRMLVDHTSELMPIVYTPVVGQACQEFHLIYRQTVRGVYLSLNDKGRVREILANHPYKDVRAIVFTDGERILGLGDLGLNGMGIPIGKLALYTTCAGIDPSYCLPVHLDMGCNRKELVNHPYYMGLKQERPKMDVVDAFVGEFMLAAQALYGKSVLLQFEDFGNSNAFRLLHDWRDRYQFPSNLYNCFKRLVFSDPPPPPNSTTKELVLSMTTFKEQPLLFWLDCSLGFH